MDFAYDHINEEILAGDDKAKQGDKSADKQGNNEKGDKAEQTAAGPSSTDTTSSNSESGNIDLSTEVQERFRALSENDWSQTLGDLWGNFRRQGETYYNEARQEVDVASEEAKKNLAEWTDTIVRNTRGLSLGAGASSETDTNKSKVNENKPDKDTPEAAEREVAEKDEKDEKAGEGETTGKEEGFISKFRAEATKRLKEIERAEDAADEALSRFGSSVASFFKEAVSITGPDNEHKEGDPLLFASKDVEGRRIIHTTRFEAELHSIHANLDCFTDDPQSAEWPEWAKDFDVAKRTEDISSDLESYPELRKAMESLVPEKVQYADFWRRYYFLRHVIESEETKRKEMLKGVTVQQNHDEEIGWGEESDTEDDDAPTPREAKDKVEKQEKPKHGDSAPEAEAKPSSPTSDTSYDIVNPALDTKKEPHSPPVTGTFAQTKVEEDSDEEDWE